MGLTNGAVANTMRESLRRDLNTGRESSSREAKSSMKASGRKICEKAQAKMYGFWEAMK